MKNLKKLQGEFSDSILRAEMGEKIGGLIVSDKISKKAAFGIYINNYQAGLTKVLEQTYPAVKNLVGEKFFKTSVREFIKTNTPESGNLDDYGEGFCDFLKNFPPAKSLAYLSDVAQFEWKYHLCLLADEVQALDKRDFANLKPEDYANLKFEFNPSAQFFSSQFPILKIWQFCQESGIGNRESLNIDIGEGGDRMIMVRKNREVNFVLLDEGEQALLQRLKEGLRFEEAFDMAAQEGKNPDLALFVNKHIVGGTWCKIRRGGYE